MTLATLDLIGQALAALLTVVALIAWIYALVTRWLDTRAARAYLREHPLPGRVYEAGSPEHHAAIVGMIQTVNERIEAQGKRIPEKTSIDIIKRTAGDQQE